MLNIDDALSAIQYYYKDIENLQVGNPLPFVKTYTVDDMDNFNELMVPAGNVKHIFYGRVTWSLANAAPAPVEQFVILTNYANTLTITVEKQALNVLKTVGTADSFTGTTEGIFVHNIQGDGNFAVSFDGYIFGVTNK